jgi:DNA-directed RNA polymerase specialized sigma24 family protein
MSTNVLDQAEAAPGRKTTGGTPPLPRQPGAATFPPRTPQDAFDALHSASAPGLIRQAYLLTGCRRLAFESVEYAFRRAWQHWPEVAVAADPVGWVRSRAHEYALSPWHRVRRAPGGRRPLPAGLFGAVLHLPPRHRRAALLCDGLGMSVALAAAETESSTCAVAGRLGFARDAIDRHLGMADEPGAGRRMLRSFLADGSTATMASARALRLSSERRARRLARTVYVGVAAFCALVAYVMLCGS